MTDYLQEAQDGVEGFKALGSAINKAQVRLVAENMVDALTAYEYGVELAKLHVEMTTAHALVSIAETLKAIYPVDKEK